MNVIFLTMSDMTSVENRGIYSDLTRHFRNQGHNVYIVSPRERRSGVATNLQENNNTHILGVKTLNLQKSNIIEKGLGQVSVEFLYKQAIKKYLPNVHFDLILYSTPPITLMGVVKYLKKQNPNAISYLLLKDIFPQNALDIHMLSNHGLKGILYRYFRKQEINLYKLSDYIGCMSPANVRYLLEHNPYVDANRVEVNPNSIELVEEKRQQDDETTSVLEKYGIPTDKPIFIYGGNLGQPQGIPFLLKCLDANKQRTDCHFVVVGTGTYFPMLEHWYKENPNSVVTVMKGLPKADYDQLVRACQVGLIFLDYRFTIPNYPSRLLSYLEYKMPIIACTDPNCDTGSIAEANGYGFYAPSNSVEAFTQAVDKMLASDMKQMGEAGYRFLKENYLVSQSYDIIMKHCEE